MRLSVKAVPKVGDMVATVITGEMTLATVVGVGGEGGLPGPGWLKLRRSGKPQHASRYPPINRMIHEVAPVLGDSIQANVLADFLEESGEMVAAEKLRKAFLLD